MAKSVSMWKHEVKEKLADYVRQVNAASTLPDELRRLDLEYAGIRAANTDATPVQGGGTVQEDRMLNNIVRRGQTADALDMARLDIARIESALALLDETERHIASVMYINRQRGAVERLREELGLDDERSVYKRAEKVLRKLTIALYGREEKP